MLMSTGERGTWSDTQLLLGCTTLSRPDTCLEREFPCDDAGFEEAHPASAMSEQRRFRKSQGMVHRKVRDEHILVPISRSMETLDSIYTLNESAGLVWEGAIAGMNELELVARVVSAFDIDRAQAAADVRQVLDELVNLRALEPVQQR